jgi:type I restriction enzyme, R subunit
LDEHAIEAKVEIMVEHFVGQVMGRIGGKAKAMIVTRSRLHAVRYKHAVDAYLKQRGYPFKALVAFSGTVKDGGIDYTESNMNGFSESKTAETFKRDEYRLLIVAEKFQTGFDQPLLHTMYVDKRLVGLHAVQTLSRLNRTCPGKEETMVLDFANESDDIQKSFVPYYDRTLLSEDTDPNVLYDLQTKLADFQFYTEAEVNRFAEVYFNPKGTQDRLHAALAPAVERYKEANEDDRVAFRGRLQDYVRLYAYLSQVITFVDADLERLYVYGRLLLRKLPVARERLPVEIQQNIDIESYRLQKTSSGKIKLERGARELEPVKPKGPTLPMPEEIEPLSRIIQELNERFGIHLGSDVQNSIQHLQEALVGDPALEASMRVNAPENARLTFNHVVNDRLQEMVEGHFQFYKLVNDDPEVAKELLDWLFEQYLKRLGAKE